MANLNYTYLKEVMKRLPEEFITQGMTLKEDRDALNFSEGDFANQIYSFLIEQGLAVDRLGCAYIAASLMGDEGRTHSVYEYAKVADRLQPELRSAYDMLPFSHLRYASQFEEMAQILDVDLQMTDKNGGRPPSKADLQNAVESAAEKDEPLTVQHFNDPPPLSNIIRTALQVLRSLSQIVNSMESVLPGDTRIRYILRAIDEVISDLQARKEEGSHEQREVEREI